MWLRLAIWLLASWLLIAIRPAHAQPASSRPATTAAERTPRPASQQTPRPASQQTPRLAPQQSAYDAKLAWQLLAQERWLELLPQSLALARRQARLMRLDEQHEALRQKLGRLPDPAGTIISDEKARRARRRAAVERELGRIAAEIRRLEQPIVVDGKSLAHGLRRLSRPGYWSGEMSEQEEVAGRRAVYQELGRRTMTVRVVRDHHVAGWPRVWQVRVDGALVPVDARGVVLEELLDSFTHPVHAELREVFFAAVEQQRAFLARWRPAKTHALLDIAVRNGLEAQLRAEAPEVYGDIVDAAAQDIQQVAAHRRQVAGRMAAAARQATAPLAITLAMLVPGGPVDLLLEVVPVAKLGHKAVHLGKRALAARKARNAEKRAQALAEELSLALDTPAQRFLGLAAKLGQDELVALRAIHRQTGSEELIVRLLRQREQGNVDLLWLTHRLERKRLDTEFVRRFSFDADLVEDYTLYDANPSWRVLQAIVERRAVTDGQRASLASKVMGLLGERAAAALVRDPRVATRLLGRAGARLDPRSGVWARKNGFDIVALSDKQELLVGEVKNWSKEMWEDPKQRKRVLTQLERHDSKLHGLTQTMQLMPVDVKAKVLFVAEDGFVTGLANEQARAVFVQQVEALGWQVERIPRAQIITFNTLIDTLR